MALVKVLGAVCAVSAAYIALEPHIGITEDSPISPEAVRCVLNE